MGSLWDAILKNLTPALGSFFIIDLIAATTNAFNGALLARRPTHYRHYTRVGIVILAIFGGIGGGVMRDILLNTVPDPLQSPYYVVFATLAAVLALYLNYHTGQKVREGMFRFMAAFSLPWFAALGAYKSLEAGLPPIVALAVGVTGATTGRFLIDITSGMTPKHFLRGEWFVGTALLTSAVYLPLWYAGLSIWPATLIAVAVGFTFRILALHYKWEEPEPWEPPEAAHATAPAGRSSHALDDAAGTARAHPTADPPDPQLRKP
ncbi:trimeric intracellular cation channel family protein [Pseudonocardia sp. T1-2H]|uniref:trimeric intracellular cation channel family protein n=1 Tax=Pseudonocardia sp. T1-2H TaxID=3128899 RepID=UPI003100BD44